MWNDTKVVVSVGFCLFFLVFLAACCSWLTLLVFIVGFRWLQLVVVVYHRVDGLFCWLVLLVSVVDRLRWSSLLVGVVGFHRWLVLTVDVSGWHCWAAFLASIAGRRCWSSLLVVVAGRCCWLTLSANFAGRRCWLSLLVCVLGLRCWRFRCVVPAGCYFRSALLIGVVGWRS